jgi:hypothetical protein
MPTSPLDVVYRRGPLKALRGMQPAKATDVRAVIVRIAEKPLAPNNNVRPLRGVPNGYRVRVGDCRV